MKTPATPNEMTSAAPAVSDSASSITIPVSKAGHYITTLPIASIQIGKRFRQDHGDLGALAASIKELGLLQPIAVDRDRNLIFGERRLRAHQHLGLDTIQARVIEVDALLAEHAENAVRKDFTTSERVAIAKAIEEKIGNRQGQRTDRATAELQQNFAESKGKKAAGVAAEELVQNFAEVGATPSERQTRAIAAKAAGFGNAETYRQARKVAEEAVPELVDAMDKGEIAVSTAAKLAKAAPGVQKEAASKPKAAPALAKEAAPKRVANTARLMDNLQRDMPLFNAGQIMIVLRGALAALEPRQAQLSARDAATVVKNLRGAMGWLVARFPALGGEDQGGRLDA